jgi:histidine triad (HIT) family protein
MTSDPNCIFCKIFRSEIPAKEVTRTEDALVFRDLNPQAPSHLLVIPKRHVANLGEFVAQAPAEEVAGLFRLAAETGSAAAPGGYRVVTNSGADAGQTVFHVHLHVLAGRPMHWPPG